MSEQRPAGPLPPAGWYPNRGGVQWWDGTQWTGQPTSAPPAHPQQRQVQPATVSYVPVQTNHTFHLIMSVLTCGLWAVLVWLPMGIVNQLRRNKIVTRPY